MSTRPGPLGSLRALKVSDIDLEAARRHFDLPIDDQFATQRDLMAGLKDTKAAYLSMFAGKKAISIVRVMDGLPEGWADGLEPGDDVGACWSYALHGALAATRLSEGDEGVVLKATVDPSDVDWETTVAVGTFHEGECEIILRDDASIVLSEVIDLTTMTTARDFPDDFVVGSGGAPEPDEIAPEPWVQSPAP